MANSILLIFSLVEKQHKCYYHSYLLYSSSYPSHVRNSISYSQFLRLCRLCSEDSDFAIIPKSLLQNDPDTGRIFSQPLFISLKRDKLQVTFQSEVHSKQVIYSELLNARARYKTCPILRNVEKISGPSDPSRSSPCSAPAMFTTNKRLLQTNIRALLLRSVESWFGIRNIMGHVFIADRRTLVSI